MFSGTLMTLYSCTTTQVCPKCHDANCLVVVRPCQRGHPISTPSAAVVQAQKQHTRLTSRRHTVSCHALDDKQGGQGSNVSRQVADIAGKFNPVYLAITGEQ